jgi:uncharacterized protein YndB with AHSA1/START domain
MNDRFVVERDYAASPEQLFRAWTDVATLTRWFGCGSNLLWDVHIWDVREGGEIFVSLNFDGKPYEVRGRFLLVDPPRRLRYRWTANETVDVTIRPRGSGSLLRIEHSWPPTQDDRSMIDAGWTGAVEQLDAALTSGAGR